MITKYIVERWSRYQLARGNFTHDETEDKTFDSLIEAENYAKIADSGFFGDTSYRYKIKTIDL